MNTGHISNLLRSTGLINSLDRLRFQNQKLKNRRQNQAFLKLNPEIKLPGDWLLYETFRLDYSKYYDGGKETAIWLLNHLSKYIELKDLHILDWGCGPGRIIRHLPSLVNNSCTFYGTDVNAESINWCKQNLSGIHFNFNSMDADLPFPDSHFDVIYGISVLTHLSESAHFAWFAELVRILKSSGILVVTTQGSNFRKKLSNRECNMFDRGQLVVRGEVDEGGRTFSAFQPEEFMHRLFKKVQVLRHEVRTPAKENLFPQDLWIVRKDKRK